MTRRKLPEVLSTDAGLTVLLASLATVLFVVYPFMPLGATGRLLVTAGLTAVLISGSVSLRDRPRLRAAIVALAAFAFLGHAASNVVASKGVLIWSHAGTILFLGATAGGLLAKVTRAGKITSRRIQGAVAIYLMLGLVWSFAYSLIELCEPGSFDLPAASQAGESMAQDERMRHLVYFSFVTLTTLGYGDVAATSPGARTLAVLEALVGQLYLVILIARLVSLQIAHSDRPPGKG